MNATQICKISGKSFVTSQMEKEILQKISPLINGKQYFLPLPDTSPQVRIQSLVLNRNDQFLFQSVSCFSGKKIISIFPPEFSGKICSKKEWFSDNWDALSFGLPFNFSLSFFQNFKILQDKVPRAATTAIENENCEYTTGTGYSKNCYLINSSEYAEDCMYSKLIQKGSDIVDCSYVYNSQLLYECFNVENCYGSQYLQNCKNCSDSWFLKNCIGCSNCFGSVNLKNKEYYFLNKKHTKEEYFQKLHFLHLNSAKQREKIKTNFPDFFQKFPQKFAEILNSQGCTGDYILNSKNCQNCYDIDKSEDCKNVYVAGGNTSTMSCANTYIKAELCYMTTSTINIYNCNFCLYVFNSSNLWYCEQCYSCSDCFGCVGLRNKKYCILNVQYSQEEYQKIMAQIIEHMQSTGEWGQFFPRNFSPFPYNISLAQDYFPLSKEEIMQQEFAWHEEEISQKPEKTTTLPDTIKETDSSYINKTLICEISGKAYRITPQEFTFYQKTEIPLPKISPHQRHLKRMKLRNPRILHLRNCQQCNAEIISTVSAESTAKIVCEQCYSNLLD